MSHHLQAPETDLILPFPEKGEQWDPHTIHTHYFGFSIPEANIGAFIYVRYQPVFNLCQGGVGIFQGIKRAMIEADHLNYQITMPFPSVIDNTIALPNGLKMEFITPGKETRVSYQSEDGETHFDLLFTANMPLLARGHVMAGEDKDTDANQQPGGSEQFTRCTGKLTLNGKAFDVDCFAIRDRSWRQVRVEKENPYPPVGWSPMMFNENFAINQVGFEHPDFKPAWQGLYQLPENAPMHHYGWLYKDGEIRDIKHVRRQVLKRHPQMLGSLEQEIQVEDDQGDHYHFKGEAIAMSPMPAWPNVNFIDSVYRWQNEAGETTYCTYQEVFYNKFARNNS